MEQDAGAAERGYNGLVVVLMNTGGIAATNCYLVADGASGQAVLFDAPNDTAGELLQEAKRRGYDVIGLWLTHGHFDHIADHPEISRHFPNAKVLIHRLDGPKLRHPNAMSMLLPIKLVPREPDGYVEDGQKLMVGSLDVEVIHTPGHSPGHVMYYFPRQQALVGGDLIIMGAVGRTDLPDADPDALDESIRRVMKFPPTTQLLPGHGSPSTLGDEHKSNPYVRQALGE